MKEEYDFSKGEKGKKCQSLEIKKDSRKIMVILVYEPILNSL